MRMPNEWEIVIRGDNNYILGSCPSEEEMETERKLWFYQDFAETNPELAKELMVDLENAVADKVYDLLDWRGQKYECFFTEEEQAEIIAKIKKAIWKQVVIDLLDYGM